MEFQSDDGLIHLSLEFLRIAQTLRAVDSDPGRDGDERLRTDAFAFDSALDEVTGSPNPTAPGCSQPPSNAGTYFAVSAFAALFTPTDLEGRTRDGLGYVVATGDADGADDFLVGDSRRACASGLVDVSSGRSRTPTRVVSGRYSFGGHVGLVSHVELQRRAFDR